MYSPERPAILGIQVAQTSILGLIVGVDAEPQAARCVLVGVQAVVVGVSACRSLRKRRTDGSNQALGIGATGCIDRQWVEEFPGAGEDFVEQSSCSQLVQHLVDHFVRPRVAVRAAAAGGHQCGDEGRLVGRRSDQRLQLDDQLFRRRQVLITRPQSGERRPFGHKRHVVLLPH